MIKVLTGIFFLIFFWWELREYLKARKEEKEFQKLLEKYKTERVRRYDVRFKL